MNYILAICDSEQEYTYQLVKFLENKKGFPFQLQIFTAIETLIDQARKQPIFMALISEDDYKENYEYEGIENVFLLGEEKEGKDNRKVFNKYQSSDKLIKDLLQWIIEKNIITKMTAEGPGLKMIGVYSPVGRCLKTSFAFVLGQLLSKKYKVLYINLESYSGLGKLLEKSFTTDLSELIYHLQNSKESFGCRIGKMIEHVGELDILPPFDSYLDFISVSGDEWIYLFKEIEKSSRYEYLIIDLSDAIQGLFDILRICNIVYTLSREDGFAEAKIKQYEEVLKRSNYQDIWEKTKYCKVPKIKNLPPGLLQLTYTELSEFVKKRMEEDLDER